MKQLWNTYGGPCHPGPSWRMVQCFIALQPAWGISLEDQTTTEPKQQYIISTYHIISYRSQTITKTLLSHVQCHTIVEALQKNATEIKLCRWEHPDGKFDWTWGVRSLKPQCLPPFSRVNSTGFRDTCLPFQRHPDQSGRSEPANALSYIQSTRNLNTNFAAMHDHACILHWV